MSENNGQQYFYKELWSAQIFLGGAPVPFEQLDGNRGVLALTPGKDDALIATLNGFATAHRYGVVKISADDYAKKKQDYPPAKKSQGKRPDMLQLSPHAARQIFKQPPTEQPSQSPGAPAAVGDRGFAPLDVPPPITAPIQPGTQSPGAADAPPAEVLSAKSTFKPTTARASQKVKQTATVPAE